MRPADLAILLLAATLNACGDRDEFALRETPGLDDYCRAAQRLVTRTMYPVRVQIHDDFDAFVKSKALIEGPTIQQYVWRNEDGAPVGISCKLKSADHLNLAFGAGTAGPDGACQDMNRAVFEKLIRGNLRPAYTTVVFDPLETVTNTDEPGMTGPDWLAPYTATRVDEDGALHIKAKGFQVDFGDTRFAQAPARFRGIHYCHFLAPDYFDALLSGRAEPGIVIGKRVDISQPPASGAQPGDQVREGCRWLGTRHRVALVEDEARYPRHPARLCLRDARLHLRPPPGVAQPGATGVRIQAGSGAEAQQQRLVTEISALDVVRMEQRLGQGRGVDAGRVCGQRHQHMGTQRIRRTRTVTPLELEAFAARGLGHALPNQRGALGAKNGGVMFHAVTPFRGHVGRQLEG
jgi:hypothetical protein